MIPSLRTTELLQGRYCFGFWVEFAVWRVLVAEPGKLHSPLLNGVTVAFRPINKRMWKDGPLLKWCITHSSSLPWQNLIDMILNSHNASQPQSAASWHSSLASQSSHRWRARGVLAGKADTVTFCCMESLCLGALRESIFGFCITPAQRVERSLSMLDKLEGGREWCTVASGSQGYP